MDKGFTLLESVIVMVIITIIAAVVVIRWNFDPIKLDSAARKVTEDVRYAQKLAISLGPRTSPLQLAGITFNLNGYSIYNDVLTAIPAKTAGDPCSTDAAGNFIVAFNTNRCSNYSGVTLSTLTPTIYFNSLGRPVNAAGTAVGNQFVTVTYKGKNKTITIEANTGRLSY